MIVTFFVVCFKWNVEIFDLFFNFFESGDSFNFTNMYNFDVSAIVSESRWGARRIPRRKKRRRRRKKRLRKKRFNKFF